MKIQANLNETERVDFLKENREGVIKIILSYVDKKDLKEVMTTLLQVVSSSTFYDFCNMESRDFDVNDAIYTIASDTGLTVANDNTQDFFEQQRRNQMDLL